MCSENETIKGRSVDASPETKREQKMAVFLLSLKDHYCGQCSRSSDEWHVVGSSTITTRLFFLSESWVYIMTWQAARIIQLLPRPINTKLSALISSLLHNEVMFAHTEVEMTQLDRVFSSRFGIRVDRFRWSFRRTLEDKTRRAS